MLSEKDNNYNNLRNNKNITKLNNNFLALLRIESSRFRIFNNMFGF